MKGYNIYYKNIRINKQSLSNEELNNVFNHEYIYKQIGTDVIKIYTKDIKIVNTTII